MRAHLSTCASPSVHARSARAGIGERESRQDWGQQLVVRGQLHLPTGKLVMRVDRVAAQTSPVLQLEGHVIPRCARARASEAGRPEVRDAVWGPLDVVESEQWATRRATERASVSGRKQVRMLLWEGYRRHTGPELHKFAFNSSVLDQGLPKRGHCSVCSGRGSNLSLTSKVRPRSTLVDSRSGKSRGDVWHDGRLVPARQGRHRLGGGL
jgi:hypothetical protein